MAQIKTHTKTGTSRETLHTFDDGRGNRDVYVDGKQIACVVMADELHGVVEYYWMPLRVDKYSKQALTQSLFGVVKVVMRED